MIFSPMQVCQNQFAQSGLPNVSLQTIPLAQFANLLPTQLNLTRPNQPPKAYFPLIFPNQTIHSLTLNFVKKGHFLLT